MQWILTFLLLVSIASCRATKLTVCQKSYFMLRQCGSEIFDTTTVGQHCCSLLAAFDARGCFTSEPQLQQFEDKSTLASIQALRNVCELPSPPMTVPGSPEQDAVRLLKREKALVLAIQQVSKARRGDISMLDDIMSIAKAILAIEKDNKPIIGLAVQRTLEHHQLSDSMSDSQNSQKTEGKRRGVMLQGISLEIEEEFSDYDSTSSVCACQNIDDLPQLHVDTGLFGRFKYSYTAARLSLCKFTCSHRRSILCGLILQMIVLSGWILFLFTRTLSLKLSGRRHHLDHHHQFIIEDAADPRWIEEPLLGDEEKGFQKKPQT